jgi:hypothetical protein
VQSLRGAHASARLLHGAFPKVRSRAVWLAEGEGEGIPARATWANPGGGSCRTLWSASPLKKPARGGGGCRGGPSNGSCAPRETCRLEPELATEPIHTRQTDGGSDCRQGTPTDPGPAGSLIPAPAPAAALDPARCAALEAGRGRPLSPGP